MKRDKKIFALIIAVLFLLFNSNLSAQTVSGVVFEIAETGEKLPLIGANIVWEGTEIGTSTDVDGKFTIDKREDWHILVISYVGFDSDTVNLGDHKEIEVVLKPSTLGEIEVESRRKSTKISVIKPINTQIITEKELFKAACCNLSESFETNPSIDVSFSDAVTGTRQIEMLGLAGKYVTISRENMPYVRGLASSYGLTYIPGTWVNSIQVTKGVGPVVNGFESMTGQINVELKKPEDSEKLYLNFFANEGGRFEGNVVWTQAVNSKWSTTTLFHTKQNPIRIDRNNDGFLDNPLASHYLGMNRWKYVNKETGIQAQIGVNALNFNTLAGQKNFKQDDEGSSQVYGIDLNDTRLETFGKVGYVFKGKPYKSIGLQLSASYHKQENEYGLRNHDATHQNYYANLIYQSIISNTFHKFKTGLTYLADVYDENFNGTDYDRIEMVPGAFFEYTYDYKEKFTLIGGIRTDYNSIYGLFFTPRLHSRLRIGENVSIRISGGRGQRTSNIFAENTGILASSRVIDIRSNQTNGAYSLDPEVSWNYGANYTHCFKFGYREGTLSVDFYRTDFQNQVVLDLDESLQAIFYNLDGKSFSNSIQVEINQEIVKHFDVKLAYRWLDVKTDYISGLRAKPLTAQHRWFVNLAYETNNNWIFDATLQWRGIKRIPDTYENPPEYQLNTESPSYFILNAQITKSWKNDKWSVYLGMENIANFKQSNPILSAENPFSPYFDASMVWGSVFGRMTYVGMRFKLF